MRLLIDVNVSYRLVAALRSRGYDISSVLEKNPNAADIDRAHFKSLYCHPRASGDPQSKPELDSRLHGNDSFEMT